MGTVNRRLYLDAAKITPELLFKQAGRQCLYPVNFIFKNIRDLIRDPPVGNLYFYNMGYQLLDRSFFIIQPAMRSLAFTAGQCALHDHLGGDRHVADPTILPAAT
jgi:hypothetical protein